MENMFDPEMVLANGAAQDIASGMKAPLLPPGMSPEEFAQLPLEHQQGIHRQLLAQQQQAFADSLSDGNTASQPPNINQKGWKEKAKKYDGLLEWILERDGHEFLVPVPRSFIKDKFNLQGLKEKFMKDLNHKDDRNMDAKFNQYIKHLYKSSAPSP